MKINKFYMAAVATAICTALIAPVFTMPVYAGNSNIIWEGEEPFVTALWGKYSKFNGKLVYRLANVENKDFYYKMVDYLKKALIYGHTSRISS